MATHKLSRFIDTIMWYLEQFQAGAWTAEDLYTAISINFETTDSMEVTTMMYTLVTAFIIDPLMARLQVKEYANSPVQVTKKEWLIDAPAAL